ncbi:MAG: 2-oxo-4-hydroxy-4-carboxy-5-ureidoimidazoline decarboxylase [Sphingobacteriales bacterium]
MNLVEFNKLDKETALKELFSCCGSSKWVSLLMNHFPFISEQDLIDKAATIWYDECNSDDWQESFAHHPKIGDKKSLEQKFAGKEQAGIAAASSDTINALAKANADYENKFARPDAAVGRGFIFIVCATGKSAEEMLRLLQDRLQNDKEDELNIAMGEQHKITIIRLKKLLAAADWQWMKPSQITTHVLDTSVGIPGKGITIRLKSASNKTIAQSVTNADGRIGDLLPSEKSLRPGNYKMVFDTGNYFKANKTKGFYPEIEIQFTVSDNSHYHVPLLINPFGYSTYRGN